MGAGPRVAVVHERFTEHGGSEAVVEQMLACWPQASVYAPVVDRSALPPGLRGADVRPGPLDHLYRGGRSYAHLLPLLPVAMARLRIDDCDLVLASHHAFANRARPPRPDVPVVCYVHTPARWIHDPTLRRGEWGGRVGSAALAAFAASQRKPDRRAAARPALLLANSTEVAARIARWWGRCAAVLPPPVNTDFFTPDPSVAREDFLLLAGRLVPYKRPDLAVRAARRAGVRLVVAGDGRMRATVQALAGPGVDVLGRVDDDELLALFRRCRGLVFPGVEDAGIVPVEAQACGAPVLALRRGGVLDTVVDGVTGRLYDIPAEAEEEHVLAAAMLDFDSSSYDAATIRLRAERFSRSAFRVGLTGHVAKVLAAAS